MKYLLIVLALGLVLSPLLALQPSPRQRQLQRLRACALARGLQPQFLEPQGGTTPGTAGRAISYRLPLAPDKRLQSLLPMPRCFERGCEPDAPWRRRGAAGDSLDEALLGPLPGLPQDAFQVSVAARRVSVEWYERGDESAVDAIAEVLNSLQQTLLHFASGAAPEESET